MIQLESYSIDFQNEYWKAVCKIIDNPSQKKIVDSCKKFLPTDFFTGNKDEFFKSLILAPFEKLKEAEAYITKNTISTMKTECFYKTSKKNPPIRKVYKTIHDDYTLLANSVKKGTAMRVRIVKNAELTVCPYCNRDYINCRAEKVSGAQLDHFFSKSEFPLFAVCLYNLVPVCGNCNRVKSAKSVVFVSPFDNSIDWEKDISFSYSGSNLKDIKIIIKSKGDLENNINGMRINEAYQIHGIEVLELIEKQQTYNITQRKEFKKVLAKVKLTDLEIKNSIFGPEITKECMRTKPLGKMMSDLHKELKIY
ncbi:hypothetical protein LGL55_11880 [Clostridium tagluense]|uniref:hypothetical protein n=1 Tax=Clostridium tagluense TaxID=360422 RepID=UPI001CF321A9|nr:hypothetical protein [Clostridium tagluense]MCB2312087.1 hypothetical protein [Clostridium tagluense]MCB2316728.1 hypothetical protein [Clostridium tagluense]MCB2321532.1 hypothetical protein [Clostridium tagluense]MCB2326597.1 hypothetical protein [Clostridium tagluense]MCB2331320.1 hypothetical protein [Clostridium tagluense]